MTSGSSKDFGPIREDYAFFEDHATEAAQDARAYAVHVRALPKHSRPIPMLDIGCGEGRFSSRFLEACGLPADRLRLTLVEPDEVYRRRAVERLERLTAHPVSAWPAMPAELDGRFDLVLANHVFYYVTNLDEVVGAIRRLLAPAGLFLAAMAGQNNLLIQFWNHCFGLLGKPVPFHTGEDFAAALSRCGIGYLRKEVSYTLEFPDAEENRLRILRFLLGSHFADVPRPPMLELFDPHAEDGRIVMRITHDHYILRGAVR
ncbi:MAG: class I SAM-dependent methyltransferase [Pirellulaceae bacterium]